MNVTLNVKILLKSTHPIKSLGVYHQNEHSTSSCELLSCIKLLCLFVSQKNFSVALRDSASTVLQNLVDFLAYAEQKNYKVTLSFVQLL